MAGWATVLGLLTYARGDAPIADATTRPGLEWTVSEGRGAFEIPAGAVQFLFSDGALHWSIPSDR